MAQFKSYASQQSVQPIQLPDLAAQFERKAAKELQYLKENAAYEQSQAERKAQAMQYAQNVEEKSRERNFRLEQQSRDRVQEAIQQNYQTSIENAKNANAGTIKTLGLLAELAPKAGEVLQQIDKNIQDGRKLTVHQGLYATGLSYSELMELYKLDKNMTDQALAENTFIQGIMQRSDTSIQQIRYLMRHSNARYWNESRALTETMGANYRTAVQENMDKEFMFEGKPITLNQVQQTGDDRGLQFILNNIRSEYIRGSGMLDMSPEIVAQYAHPTMRSIEAQLATDTNAQFKKLAALQAQESKHLAFQQTYATSGWDGLWANFQQQPNKQLAKQDLLGYVGSLAATNPDAASELLSNMANTVTMVNGQAVNLADYWAPQLVGIKDAIFQRRARIQQEYELEQRGKVLERDQMIQQILNQAAAEGIDLTDADIDAIEARADQIMPGVDSSILENYKQNNTADAKFRIAKTKELQDLADRGLLTEERLRDMGLPNSVMQPFLGLARQTSADRKANDNFKPQMQAIENLVKSPPQIRAKPDGTYNWTVPLMAHRLQNQFLTKYAELRAAGDPRAADSALVFVQQSFQSIASNPGSFSQDSSNLGGYTMFTKGVKPTAASAARMQWVQSSIARLGTKTLDSNGSIFTISELNEIQQSMLKRGYKMDPMAEYVGNLFGVDPFTVINRQRIAAGMDALQLPESASSFAKTVNPKIKRMLDSYQTPQISTRAMISTKAFNLSLVPKGYGPMVVKAAQGAGIPPNYVAALAEIESTWNPNKDSRAGAIGLMQIVPSYHPSYTGGKDPQANLSYGAQYYAQLLQKYGDPVKAAGAYNSGPGRFDEYLKNGVPLPAETVRHMKKFSTALAKYGDPTQLRSTTTMRNTFAVRQYVSGDPAIQGMNTGSVIYDPVGHGGQAYHNHYEFATKEQAAAAKKLYESKGYRVTSYMRPGDPGAHGKGYAIDVAPPLDLPYTAEAERKWSAEANAVIGYDPLQ